MHSGVLHLIFSSPIKSSALSDGLKRADLSDPVLLLQDAVLAAVASIRLDPELVRQLFDANRSVYVLRQDLAVLGYADASLRDGVQSIEVSGMVELVRSVPLSMSWS